MKYVFKSYEEFQRKNSSNHSNLSRRSSIQIRRTWQEREFSRVQWWAEYISYETKDVEVNTVNDLLTQVEYSEIYLNNPGSFLKIFESNQNVANKVDNTKNIVEIPKEIMEKVKSLGGEALNDDGDYRYKIRLNDEVNWLTYDYIMNRL